MTELRHLILTKDKKKVNDIIEYCSYNMETGSHFIASQNSTIC